MTKLRQALQYLAAFGTGFGCMILGVLVFASTESFLLAIGFIIGLLLVAGKSLHFPLFMTFMVGLGAPGVVGGIIAAIRLYP